MNMVPASAAHQSPGPSSIVPPPPLSRPPTAPTGPNAAPHHPHHQTMPGPYGHHHAPHQPHGLPASSYSMPPSQSPSSRGGLPAASHPPHHPHHPHPPHHQHQPHHQHHSSGGGSATPSSHYPHHPLHSPSGGVSGGRPQHPSHHRSSSSVGMPPQHRMHHSGHPSMHAPGAQGGHMGMAPQGGGAGGGAGHPGHSAGHPQYRPHYQHQHAAQAMGGGPGSGSGSGGGSQSGGMRRGGGSTGGGGGSAGGQSQPSYLPKNLNGDWQSDNDMGHRRQMIQNIVQLLKQRDKNSSQEWLNKLPQMVKQLEVSLYRSAPSFEAYADISTLKSRLQELALQISKKTSSEGSSGSKRPRSSTRTESPYNRPSSTDHYGMKPSASRRPPGGGSSTSDRVVRMDEINPLIGGSNQSISGPPPPGSSSGSVGSMGRGIHLPSGSTHNSGNSQRNDPDPDWKLRIRHKQQRLLLLHHSSKCEYPEGKCPTTPHCADMKRLWVHMSKCSDTNCRVPHCYSSRSILSHYRKCRDPACQSCGPVRESVRKSQDKRNRTSSSSTQGSTGSRKGSSGSTRSATFPNETSSHGSGMPPVRSGGSGHPPSPVGLANPRAPSYYTKPKPSHTPSNHPPPHANNDHMSPRNRINNHRPNSVNSSNSSNPKRERDRHEDNERRIRHNQQRLLLLRHASKCKAPEGTCKVTPHCDEMKRLWKHISDCTKKDCTAAHCMSSRAVLSHYRRCKDARCPACVPVRLTIRNGQADGGDRSPRCKPIEPDHEPSSLDPVRSDISPSDDRERKRPKIEPLPQPTDVTSAIMPDEPRSKNLSPPPPQAQVEEKKPPSVRAGSLRTKPKPSRIPVVVDKKRKETSYSLINSFSVSQIETHIKSLNRTIQLTQKDLKEKCSGILKVLQSHDHFWVFSSPVDPVELKLPDYFTIIEKPMDLGTVQKKLDQGQYHSIEEFHGDVCLTFDNATTYNEHGSVVHGMAIQVKTKFLAEYDEIINQLKVEETNRRKNERACSLCGCEKLQFEPPVFFCNGPNCPSKRIHRNRHFYVGGSNQYFWCNQCYNEIDEDAKIDMPDLSLTKSDLKKKKNDETHEENWVQCDVCDRWIHQICGLFNSRQNKDHRSKYSCPQCLCDEMKAGKKSPQPNAATAEALPRTKLSEWLENNVRSKVTYKFDKLLKDKEENEGKITIRQVTSTDRKLEVRERMKKRYAHKNYPDEFPFRCKCILVFQNLDGVDVVLFALYVYEHGEDNPPPNKRTVYISYLDSVHYMRPRGLRTVVYHEILIAYLDYARQRGFATAHIWACPPLKGDDYIFYAKPEDQKTPKDNRLRQWYIDMLTECQKREIVGKVTNMYDLYFSNKSLDATAVPYLHGDYFEGEAENVIKELEDGSKGGSTGKKNKKKKNGGNGNGGAKSKSKSKNGRKGTRSTGMEDDASSDTSNQPPMEVRDQVMVKLGETIQPMKESFIVAYLNWKDAKPEHMEVPKEIQEHREKIRKEKESLPEGESDGSTQQMTVLSMTEPRDSNGNRIKVIDDDNEELDCDNFNNRQLFLNLCRGNHYQFDELRRAKHTSMMVLWHLHNRHASKFVKVCAVCAVEILSGKRYTCNTCTDFDLCEECHQNPNANRGLCTHTLVAKPVDSENGESENSSSSNMTEKQRQDRQRNIQLHIQLLEHAALCVSPTCSSSNCRKMKGYLKHNKECKINMVGGCKICKRICTLLRYHAQNCKNNNCKIPQCIPIRERLRQLAKQQQAMDDRRRQVMNRQYRSGATT